MPMLATRLTAALLAAAALWLPTLASSPAAHGLAAAPTGFYTLA